jgi:hypothetical protein
MKGVFSGIHQARSATRVAVQLPTFWADRPAVWFDHAEALFTLGGISREKIKFCHVISLQDHWYVTEVEDIITYPLDQYPYTTLRTELVRWLYPSREQRIRQLLTLEEMSDRKPSQSLMHLTSLAPDVPHDFLRRIWSTGYSLTYRSFYVCMYKGWAYSALAPRPTVVYCA